MPANKYSFATVLAGLEQTRGNGSGRDWRNSPDRLSYGIASHDNTGGQDDFYLDPEPPAPISRPSSSHVSKVKSSALAERRQAAPKPQNISVPVPPTKPHDDWPLPSPKPSTIKSDHVSSSRRIYHNRRRSKSSASVNTSSAAGTKLETVPTARIPKVDSVAKKEPATAPGLSISERSPTPQRPSTSKAAYDFGIKKTVDVSLADFLKEVSPPPKSPLSPLSTLRPGTGTTAQSSQASSKFSFFRGFGISAPLSKSRQASRQDSRKDSRKDSSSISSYHARTQSNPVSENTSRTSLESVQPHFKECSPPSILEQPNLREESPTVPSRQPGSATEHSEPLLETPALGSDEFHAFSDFDSSAKPASTIGSEWQTDTDAYTDSGVHGDIDTGTETDYPDEAYTSIESGSVTETEVRTEPEVHTDADNDSMNSAPTSIITAADLSAAPPNIRSSRNPANHNTNSIMQARPASRRSSIDSAAPPPISLRRSEKELLRTKNPRRDALSGRFGVLKRATSKPAARPVQPVVDLEREKRERMAELELLTKSVPYEKAIKGMTPFTNKNVAAAYPIRRATGNPPVMPERTKSKKRQIGMGLREERYLLGAMEDVQWRERERRARMAAEWEYMKIMREGEAGSALGSRGLATIEES